MSFYGRMVFPCVCDFLLNRSKVAEHRRALLQAVHGDVLEIGLGTGLNLPCYPCTVRKLTTVDPNAGMQARARKRSEAAGIQIDAHVLSSEHLPFADGCFDTVVSTFTLCSIAEVKLALGEIHRVLKPGGQFLFFEHGLSPEAGVRKWQHRLNWLEQLFADGCQLNRDIDDIVRTQPFEHTDIEQFYLPDFPKTHGYVYRGRATKSTDDRADLAV